MAERTIKEIEQEIKEEEEWMESTLAEIKGETNREVRYTLELELRAHRSRFNKLKVELTMAREARVKKQGSKKKGR